jgi:hypothetical protein
MACLREAGLIVLVHESILRKAFTLPTLTD